MNDYININPNSWNNRLETAPNQFQIINIEDKLLMVYSIVAVKDEQIES